MRRGCTSQGVPAMVTGMAQDLTETTTVPAARYEKLIDVIRSRMTNRAFAPCDIPLEHFKMILEAARHAPSGANSQPWHYVVVRDPAVKQTIGQCFLEEEQRRVKLRM